MIAIYDFDGTLTPSSLPQYAILKQCGCTNAMLMGRVAKRMAQGKSEDFYETYYKCYREILTENGIEMSKENICLGAGEVKLNNGVEEYFKRFQSTKTGIKHYIVTSGIKDYVAETVISSLVDGIYGVEFEQQDGKYRDISFLLTDKKKVDVIQQIQKANAGTRQIIYFGDGLTDELAFEYVHRIGGKSIFVASNERAEANYQKLNRNGMMDEYFEADFGLESKISQYIQRQMEKQIGEGR